MERVNPADCPRESDARWHTDEHGNITFSFDPVPAPDGRCYITASQELMEQPDWIKAMDAAHAAGWKITPVAEVRYTCHYICEVSRFEGK